jgi:hypothetical protein
MELIICILMAMLARQYIRACFYSGYFRQKQRNLGVDPDVSLKKEFGWAWWLMR